MQNQMKTKNLPKVTIICSKNSEKVYSYPSIRKTKYFLHVKAKSYLKKGFLITIRVKYDDGSHNSGSYQRLEDLYWAYQTFVKEYV